MSAYCLFQNISISDESKMQEYAEKVMPVTKSFEGRYVVMGGSVEVMEGEWRPAWPVMIKFPSLRHAHDWYSSQDYKSLKELRQSAGEFSAVFLEGVEE